MGNGSQAAYLGQELKLTPLGYGFGISWHLVFSRISPEFIAHIGCKWHHDKQGCNLKLVEIVKLKFSSLCYLLFNANR